MITWLHFEESFRNTVYPCHLSDTAWLFLIEFFEWESLWARERFWVREISSSLVAPRSKHLTLNMPWLTNIWVKGKTREIDFFPAWSFLYAKAWLISQPFSTLFCFHAARSYGRRRGKSTPCTRLTAFPRVKINSMSAGFAQADV